MSAELRINYTTDPAGCPVVIEHSGKVFAVIGPFDGHTDIIAVQRAIAMLLRGWNACRDEAQHERPIHGR